MVSLKNSKHSKVIFLTDSAKVARLRAEKDQNRDDAVRFEEELNSLIKSNTELTKTLKERDVVLGSLSVNNDNVLREKRVEIAEMEREIIELEEAWVEANEELTMELAKAKRQFEERRVDIELKQEKIDFYEENYSRLVQDLKLEVQRRNRLIEEYKLIQKDTKREHLSQILEETKQSAKDYESQTLKALQEIKTLNSTISNMQSSIKKASEDIEKKIGEGEEKKKKDDKTYDQLRTAFSTLLKTHSQMRTYMEKYIDLRLKNSHMEERVLDLRRNKYQEIAEGLKKELQEMEGN